MRMTTLAFLAALVPMTAAAGPNRDSKPDDETDTYQWSSSEDGRLGVMVMGLNRELRTFFGAPKDSGLLVAEVADGSPAERAGIRVGDVITRFGADKVQDAADILTGIARMSSTRQTSVAIVRDHKPMTLQVTFAHRNEPRRRNTI